MSAREAAIAALYATIAAALSPRSPPPTVLRNETIPQRLPPGGLVIVQDGDTIEQTAIMSPLRWQVQHNADVVVAAPGATPAQRALALDSLMVAISTAIVASRTLGGAVEWATPDAATFDDLTAEGAAAIRTASIPVQLWFTTTETPLA